MSTTAAHDADVLIVGAGPVGAVTALTLASAGIQVVCLEQGVWPDPAKVRAGQLDFEAYSARHWAGDPNIRQTRWDYPVEVSDSDVSVVMNCAVGGGTVLSSQKWHRAKPSDFRVRSMDGVAVDWPFGYAELEPFYNRVERQVGVSGLGGDTAYPPGESPPLPPVPMREFGRRVARAQNELGWHWWPGSNAIATRAYRRLGACTQRGTCSQGCAEGAKFSADVTHWPDAVQAGAALITGARVAKVLIGAHGRAEGVLYLDDQGREHRQTARNVVLAANGIGTARLLLMSADGAHPDGVANSSGLVGRNLMVHPWAPVAGVFDEPIGGAQGAWGQQIYSLEFYETDASRGFVRGGKWGLQPTGGPVAVTRSFPNSAEQRSIWGDGYQETVARRLDRSVKWVLVAEDLPEESNRVELDPQHTDQFGLPAVKLKYRMSENTERLIAFHTDRMRESLETAGAVEVTNQPPTPASGGHLIGTARMGDDPSTSVVDRWGRAHDVPNLFIFDASIWPTSTGVNPTGTMMAVALRNAEHLVKSARSTAAAS